MVEFRNNSHSEPLLECESSEHQTETTSSIIKKLIYSSIPTIIFNVMFNVLDTILFYYIGNLNDPVKQSALGFSITYANSVSLAFTEGIAFGFCALGSSAFGAKNYQKVGDYYYKSLITEGIVLIFSSICLYNVQDIMIFMGFEEGLAYQCSLFLKSTIPYYILAAIYFSNMIYLMIQDNFSFNVYTVIIQLISAPFLASFFIEYLELELIGAGLAKSAILAVGIIFQFYFIYYHNKCPETWIKPTMKVFDNIIQVAKVFLIHASSVYVEWITYEVLTLMMAYLDVNILAGHTSAMNYIYVLFSFIDGLSNTFNSLFGHQVGDGNVYLSKKYVKVGLTLIYSSILIMAILTITFRDLIASFYIDEHQVQQVISNIITIFSIYTAASLTNCCIGFMLRILLEEKFVLKLYLICYYGISLSCAYILCFHFGLSYIGIWGGMGIGLHIMSSILIIKILKIDWEKKVNYVSTMMKKKENANEGVNIELIEIKKEEGQQY